METFQHLSFNSQLKRTMISVTVRIEIEHTLFFRKQLNRIFRWGEEWHFLSLEVIGNSTRQPPLPTFISFTLSHFISLSLLFHNFPAEIFNFQRKSEFIIDSGHDCCCPRNRIRPWIPKSTEIVILENRHCKHWLICVEWISSEISRCQKFTLR